MDASTSATESLRLSSKTNRSSPFATMGPVRLNRYAGPESTRSAAPVEALSSVIELPRSLATNRSFPLSAIAPGWLNR